MQHFDNFIFKISPEKILIFPTRNEEKVYGYSTSVYDEKTRELKFKEEPSALYQNFLEEIREGKEKHPESTAYYDDLLKTYHEVMDVFLR